MKSSLLRIGSVFFSTILLTTSAHSQTKINSVISKEIISGDPVIGRDYWFCSPMNYSANTSSDKYFTIYVTSPKTGTLHLQIGNNPPITKAITANVQTTFASPTAKNPSGSIPITTELKTSGVVEPKGIHVWSDDADLCVNFMSRVPYTSDGTYIIPTTGWGKEYVVAGYESINDPTGGADWPSEFAVVANQDATIVTITPACDLRKDGQMSTAEHLAGQPFTVNLNKGECVQYQAILPTSAPPNVTGTYISSNNPVGVMGGSVCPYIPFPNGYCDFVMDMLMPIRSWSNSYFTLPFAGRKYGGDVYLIIGSKNGQQILRNKQQVALVDKYTYYYIEDELSPSRPSIWESADGSPFSLTQFIPSAKFGAPSAGTARNQGDPAMVVIDPTSDFRKSVIFQNPKIDLANGQATFTNYLNIIIPSKSDSAHTLYDGIPLAASSIIPNVTKIEKLKIDSSSWIGYRLSYKTNTGDGAHTIVSDSGVGVYLYGYGTDDSYAWNGQISARTTNAVVDTIPLTATITDDCFNSHGVIRDNQVGGSGISSIGLDSSRNMKFTIDTSLIPGAGMLNSFYDLKVIVPENPAYAQVSVYDVTGNRTTITSTYTPQLFTLTPSVLSFGRNLTGSMSVLYDTLTNHGTIDFSISDITLKFHSGTKGFTIDSSGGLGAIKPGESRIIKIRFTATSDSVRTDTLQFSNGCLTFSALAIANNSADFTISNFDFGCVDTGKTKVADAIFPHLLYKGNINIDSIWVDDGVHFKFLGVLPVEIAEGSNIGFAFQYQPTQISHDTTIVHFHSIEAGEHVARLTGCGLVPSSVRTEGYSSELEKGSSVEHLIRAMLDKGADLALLPPTPNPINYNEANVRFTFGLSARTPLDLSLFDMLGNRVATVVSDDSHPAGIFSTEFRITPVIPSGTYIFRLAAEGEVISGKLIIAK